MLYHTATSRQRDKPGDSYLESNKIMLMSMQNNLDFGNVYFRKM